VTVGNIITSMKLLSTLDWHSFFEIVSLTEPIQGVTAKEVLKENKVTAPVAVRAFPIALGKYSSRMAEQDRSEIKLEAAFLALTFTLFQVVGSHRRSNARKLR
jgi:hypothetical protein